MTTITINRVVLEGTLEALRELLPDERDSNCGGYDARDVRQWRATADALRAALAQTAATKRHYTRIAPPQQAEPVEPVAWKQGNLVTFNEDPCPVLGGLFVQFWDGEEVAARVYANDLKALRQRCAKVNTAPPNQEPVAWMYKAEPWFDGHSWHETYETTTDKTLAYFKDKNARALCFVEK